MKIYEPFKVKNITFKSRIVMPPMVPFGIPQGEGHTLGKALLEYYGKRVHGELGLLITQSLSVTDRREMFGAMALTNDAQKDALHKLVCICRANGTRIFAQIAFPCKGYHRHERINELSIEEIKTIEDEFVRGARLCKEAGCDGVELHGANMFFLNLFSSPIANTRTDEYGGSLENRLRLASDIITRIKEFADDNFIIGYRMGWNKDLETDIATAQHLERTGADILHFSYGIREADTVMPKEYDPVICYPGSTHDHLLTPADHPYNDVVYTGLTIRKNIGVPMIAVDELWTLARAETVLEQGADFAAFGRPFLADELFLEKSRENPSFEACLHCRACAWFDDCTRCPKQKQLARRR